MDHVLQDPLAGADRVDVGQSPVPQMGVRVLSGKAELGRARQRLPFRSQYPAALAQLPGGGLQPGQGGGVGPHSGVPQGPAPGLGAAQPVAQVAELLRRGGDLIVQLGHACRDGFLLRPGRGCHLVQACPSHRIGPGEAHRAGPLVAWPGRGALAAERITGVQAPQSPVIAQPRRRIVDEHGTPFPLLTGAHGRAVPPAVIDERDAERGALVFAGPRQEQPGPPPRRREQPPEHGRLDGDQVVPGQVGPRVRTGAREDHRVGVPPLDVGVVLPAAQVIAGLVVGGEGDPGRPGGQVRRIRQEDGDLLPVRLVIVDAAERRPPVVHRVEEPVLHRDETAIPADVTVVRIGAGAGPGVVSLLGGGRRAAGNAPADQQRQPDQRVNQPAHQPDHGEPAARLGEPVSSRFTPPRSVLTPGEGTLHEAERQAAGVRCGPRLRQPRRGQLPRPAEPLAGRPPPRKARGAGRPPQRARGQVVRDRHRQEKLTPGEAHYRLVAPQQPQIPGRAIGGGRYPLVSEQVVRSHRAPHYV